LTQESGFSQKDTKEEKRINRGKVKAARTLVNPGENPKGQSGRYFSLIFSFKPVFLSFLQGRQTGWRRLLEFCEYKTVIGAKKNRLLSWGGHFFSILSLLIAGLVSGYF